MRYLELYPGERRFETGTRLIEKVYQPQIVLRFHIFLGYFTALHCSLKAGDKINAFLTKLGLHNEKLDTGMVSAV